MGGPPLPQSKYNIADGHHLENRYDLIISVADGPIWTKLGTLMQDNTPITAKWPRSKPEVEFQYGGRLFFKTGSNYISAEN